MTDRDLVYDVIYDGIKRSIRVSMDNQCFAAAVILVYSGIDAMAHLGMPASRDTVVKDDFIEWCNRYIQFACREKISGLEIYSARCSVLHTYGVESSLTRKKDCRRILYADDCVPEIRFSVDVAPKDVQVSVVALVNAFFDGIDRFLVDLFADPKRASVAEQRLRWMLVLVPVTPSPEEP